MALNPNTVHGFYTALGMLAALLVWNFAASRFPRVLQQYTGQPQ